MPFYTWASVIVNGRVVATDYAPDAGWLARRPRRRCEARGHVPARGSIPASLDDRPRRLDSPWLARIDRTGETRRSIRGPRQPGGSLPGHDRTATRAEPRRSREVFRGSAVHRYLGDARRHARWLSSGVPGVQVGQRLFPRTIPVGDYNNVWILDVDGVRLVIAATYESAPAETVRSEVRQIVESIHIER